MALCPSDAKHADGLWKTSNGAIWIPDCAENIQLRLCIIGHTGAAGHRGREATAKTLSTFYSWSTLHEDVSMFVKACIHCISTVGVEKVPRPFGPALYGTKPNDLLQFDYIEIVKSMQDQITFP